MLRLLVLPFAVLLAFGSLALMGGGAALLADGGDAGDGDDGGSALVDVGMFEGEAEREARDDGEIVAGVSMIGFGILGAILAVVLTAAALAGGGGDGGRQQQQQQVIVVTDPNARVETR